MIKVDAWFKCAYTVLVQVGSILLCSEKGKNIADRSMLL